MPIPELEVMCPNLSLMLLLFCSLTNSSWVFLVLFFNPCYNSVAFSLLPLSALHCLGFPTPLSPQTLLAVRWLQRYCAWLTAV